MPSSALSRSAETGTCSAGPARDHLLANLLVLPGLGSLLGGRKVGWIQAPLALVGFALTAFWFTIFVVAGVRTRAFPLDGGPHFRIGLLGVGLFVAAWLWALATGVQLRRHARHPSPPHRPPVLPR